MKQGKPEAGESRVKRVVKRPGYPLARSAAAFSRARKLLGTTLLALSLPATAPAHAFVLKLTTPAGEKIPMVQIGGRQFIIDTGADDTTLSEGSATALGIDPKAGTTGKVAGAGGEVNQREGVPLPGSFKPDGPSAPKAPAGQAEQSPDMPKTASVAPIDGVTNGVLGNDWLSGFNFGFITRPGGSYFYLATKAQGAQGLKTAIDLAMTLASNGPVLTDPDGRPFGTLATVIGPTPPSPLPPGVSAFDSGFNLNVGLQSQTQDLTGIPFLIKSGLPTTLISAQTALALGLNLLNLPTTDVSGDFGLVSVRQATLSFHLLDNPNFPWLSASIGVLSTADNPLNLNYLGSDLLGQLPFWEISSNEADVTRFYAAPAIIAVPEPATFGLFAAAGLLAIMVFYRHRTNVTLLGLGK